MTVPDADALNFSFAFLSGSPARPLHMLVSAGTAAYAGDGLGPQARRYI